MGEMSELSLALDEIILCGQDLLRQLHELKECLMPQCKPADIRLADSTGHRSEDRRSYDTVGIRNDAESDVRASENNAEGSRQVYTKEEIRALLASKASEDGGRFRADVKEIVKKYGNGGCLTDVPADRYPDIVREVQKLKAA